MKSIERPANSFEVNPAIALIALLCYCLPIVLCWRGICQATTSVPIAVEQRAVSLARYLKGRKKLQGSDFGLLTAMKQAAGRMYVKETEKHRAVIHLKRALTRETIGRMQALGVSVESCARNRVQVKASMPVLKHVSTWNEVTYMHLPLHAKGKEVISKAVGASGACLLHSRGFTGRGVRVGIIDLGFYGYDFLLGSELPASVVKKNFRHDLCGFSFCLNQRHGTAVAEIIHDLAPDAELYLASISTTSELIDAVKWLEKEHVDVVNCSLGYWLCGPIDGRGWCSMQLGQMRSVGILPVVAVGNSAQSHWFGVNRDENGDSIVETDEQDQGLSFSSHSFGQATVSANWNDWGKDPENARPDQDIDILVLSPNPDSDEIDVIAEGLNPQSGILGQMPIESVTFSTFPGRTYYIFLVNRKTSRQVTIHVFLGGDHSYDLTPCREAESLVQPADSPMVMAVGAADLSGDLLDFSSRGPSWDGRIKPDITGFSGLETASIPDFSGTSAAAPTVTGIAALLKQAHHDWGPDQLESTMELLARDIYTDGQDTGSGCGIVDALEAPGIDSGPDNGFWWNPEKDGTGFSIERRKGTDFLAIYTYSRSDNVSQPIWFSAHDKAFSGLTGPTKMQKWKGWPLGSPPSAFSAVSDGELSILYFKDGRGLLAVRDPVTNTIQRQTIERFIFSENFSDHNRSTGWWWDKNKPGNGIFLEVQAGTIFGAWYHYDEHGLQRWYTFSGRIPKSSDGTLTTDIIEWHGGPCLTCPQQKPWASEVGTATLIFHGREPARLDWQESGGPTGTYHLTRFHF